MGILKSFETKTESLKSTLKYKMQWCKRNCVLSLEMPPGLIGLWSFDKQALFSIICTKANIYISLSVYQWTCVCISKTGWQISSFLSVRKSYSKKAPNQVTCVCVKILLMAIPKKNLKWKYANWVLMGRIKTLASILSKPS